MTFRLYGRLCIGLMFLMLACYQLSEIGNTYEETMPAPTMENESYQWIRSGTVGNCEDMRIGVSNLIVQEYTDEHGNLVEGPTLSLSFMVRDQQAVTLRVHTGQIIEIDTYQVQILEIDAQSKPVYISIRCVW